MYLNTKTVIPLLPFAPSPLEHMNIFSSDHFPVKHNLCVFAAGGGGLFSFLEGWLGSGLGLESVLVEAKGESCPWDEVGFP